MSDQPIQVLQKVRLPDDAGGHVGYVMNVRLFGRRGRQRRMLTAVGVAIVEGADVEAA